VVHDKMFLSDVVQVYIQLFLITWPYLWQVCIQSVLIT